LDISVIVVVMNEEARLKNCLDSLGRFNEVIVVDIGSKDSSIEIAKQLGYEVFQHEWVPIVENVLPQLLPKMKNDWIIRVDPDEVLPSELVDDLIQLELSMEYGIISVPYQYYFLNKKLNTTIWGGVRPILRVINRNRVTVEPYVHTALKCKDGYKVFNLPYRSGNAVQHYWIDSYEQLFSKHERYIRMEGESRYNHGMRFHWMYLFAKPVYVFLKGFILQSGWRGGWHGWFLSIFYAYYEFRSLISLYKYSKNQK
jgi:glycosyltransferase involved in cell wall biosynthesis